MQGTAWVLALVLAPAALACGRAASTGATGHAAPAAAMGAAAESCIADFDTIHTALTRDYPGYPDRLREDSAGLVALTDSIRGEMRLASSDSACTRTLQRWIARFSEHDHHLQLWQPSPPSPRTAAPSGAAPAEPAVDPLRPTLAWRRDDSAAVLTIRSMSDRYRAAVDSLVRTIEARGAGTPYLVIDVRRNGGGATDTYRSVIPLFYTDSITRDAMDFWSSDATIAAIRERLDDPDTPESRRNQMREVLTVLEANKGGIVRMGEPGVLRLDSVRAVPRRVAVLTGRGCASSCEQLVRDAMQSRKVVVFGSENTAGLLDYGNARRVRLSSGVRRMQMPTTRARRLPEHPLDKTGVAPQVLYSRDHVDPIAFALDFIRGPFQTQADDYTRYELLEPGSGRFRILYEVSATTQGATQFFNVIRKGSVATDERVIDRHTGRPLPFDIVSGAVARAGGVRNADTTGQYIRIRLARPVPRGGETRLVIDKTYLDAGSYHVDSAGVLVFDRSLGIKRNTVVLPAGYELIAANWPSQVLEEADGRIAVSFRNPNPTQAPLVLRARAAAGTRTDSVPERLRSRLTDRARQDREIVYFLRQPETHSFELYHDYTESRPGTSRYLNVVRAGSSVSRPSGLILDTGEELRWEILTGDAIARAGLDVSDVTPETQVVVFHFPPVAEGSSVRLRIAETYTDSARYRVVNEALVWDRSFGRPFNAVVLPSGWTLTNSSIPAAVSELSDGRIRLDFVNPRPDEVNVLITARRRR